MAASPSRSSKEENAWLVRCCGQLYKPTGESQPALSSNLFLYGEGRVEAWAEECGSNWECLWVWVLLLPVERVGYCFAR